MPCQCGKGKSGSKNQPVPRHHETLRPINTNVRKYTSRADIQHKHILQEKKNPPIHVDTPNKPRSVANRTNRQFSTLGGFLPVFTRRNITILTH